MSDYSKQRTGWLDDTLAGSMSTEGRQEIRHELARRAAVGAAQKPPDEHEHLREKNAEAAAGVREGKAGHTAGPWHLSYTSIGTDEVCVAVLENDGEYAAPREEREANGWLIAAAPELLSAVRLAHTALDAATATLASLDPLPGSRLDDLCGELQAARDACEGALGRAEGGA